MKYGNVGCKLRIDCSLRFGTNDACDKDKAANHFVV
jgi:hypothetical protein